MTEALRPSPQFAKSSPTIASSIVICATIALAPFAAGAAVAASRGGTDGALRGAANGPPGAAGYPGDAGARQLDLDVELDPGTRNFQAAAVVRPGARDFRFALHRSLEVNSARADGKSIQVSAIGGDAAVRQWRVRVPADASSIRIDYGGTLPPLDPNIDHRGVLRALPPMVSRDGSFLPAGAAWYPQPAPLFSYRVAISVPGDQRALVAGRVVAETPADAVSRYRATFDFPHPADGIDLMAGPYVVRERVVARGPGAVPEVAVPDGRLSTPERTLRLRTYFFADLDAMPGLADAYLDDVRRYLDLYAKQIGAYPFAGFSVVASPLPTGYGMPTLTYLGADVLKLPFIRATSLGHEVLHDWWGNGVYVDYARGNWSEGLTTFMADYAYKERESDAAAHEMRLAWLRDFASVPADAQQTLASFRSRTHGAQAAVGYGKSAMLFVMLRDTIGAEAFEQAIRSFWQRHRFRTASWDDLRVAFERASGRSLDRFFQQWLDRRGGPTVRVVKADVAAAAARDRKAGDRATGSGRAGGTDVLALTIEQSSPAYLLDVPVEIVYAGRSELRRVRIEHEHDVVRLPVDDVPRGVRLDPEIRLWRVLDREQLPPILRQWILATSPRVVLASAGDEVRAAAQALAKRVFESATREASVESIARGQDGDAQPALLVGLDADVEAALARAGLPPTPANLRGRGTARVWTVQREDGAPVAVVAANDAESIRALLRPLPHYGGQSWLVFDGARAIERGVWPAAGRLIPITAAR